MVKIKSYPIISNLTLTNELLVSYIKNFWMDIFNDIKDTSHLMLMCKVNFADEKTGYRTLGHLRKVNFNDKELFIDYLTERLTILNDSYVALSISNITFSYVIKEGQCNDSDRALLQNLDEKLSISHNFNNMRLPISMNPSDYGEIILSNYIQVEGENYQRFIVNGGSKTYQIDVSNNGLINKVSILGKINLSWIDTRVDSENLDYFKREIGKSTIYFMDGNIILRKQLLPSKAFKSSKIDTNLFNNFYTMDIETIKENGKLIPYLICGYDGNDYITSFGKDQKTLFKNFFDQLISKIKPGSKTYIYAHNFSGFDGIFTLKQLLSYGKVTPLLFNGRLISIKVKITGDNKSDTKTIEFKDSFLSLPLSLRKLCLAFNVEIPKGFFPFLLSNIYYSGVIPKFEYWTGISTSIYESLVTGNKNKMWNFQSESIKYCKLDCKTLHEVIVKFNELIFNQFKINIHKHLTLPAIAMRIYKTHYMPKNTIYQMLGKPEWNIRDSYTGGAVDVYIPHNRISGLLDNIKSKFIKLFYYDVNSLYPYVMAYFNMPIGQATSFEGDIRKIDSGAYGYFYCKISSPPFLDHPILQRRIKTSDGVRTIAGLGCWEGWINSGEMDNAIKFGYTFEIIKGYQFKTGNVFKEYVLKMYDLRQEYPKTHAMNLIAKLLMNSLYGKFGMKLESTELSIYDCSTDLGKDKLKSDIECHQESIQDFIKIDDHFLIIRDSMLSLNYDQKEEMFHGQDINIAIASAITAGARVHMSLIKNNPDFNLYYSDTDSGVTDKPLPEFMVGSKLGQFKLEHTINKAVFLAPKVYGLVDLEGNEIIKVKGINHELASDISYNNLETLLVKDSSREFTQEKWFKKVIEGEITVVDIAYTLKTTSNKRFPIYINKDGFEIYNSTRPYNYDEITSSKNN